MGSTREAEVKVDLIIRSHRTSNGDIGNFESTRAGREWYRMKFKEPLAKIGDCIS